MVDRAYWKTIPWELQIGNITSEIARARLFDERGDAAARDAALERALDLVQVTLQCGHGGGLLKELCILQECLADCYARTGTYAVSLQQLEQYGTDVVLGYRYRQHQNNHRTDHERN